MEVEPSVKKFEAPVKDDAPPWATSELTQLETPSPAQSPAQMPKQSPAPVAPELPEQGAPEPQAPSKIALNAFCPDNWIELRKQLTIGASLGEIASHCVYLGRHEGDNGALKFLIDSYHNSLYDSAHQAQLSEALSDYFQEPVIVEISLGVAEQETPRAANVREKAERLAEAIETLQSDPAVIKFKQVFEGILDERSVQPID